MIHGSVIDVGISWPNVVSGTGPVVTTSECSVNGPIRVISGEEFNRENTHNLAFASPASYPNFQFHGAEEAGNAANWTWPLNTLDKRNLICDVSNLPLYYLSRLSLAKGNNYYETLASASLSNPYAVSGQLLEEYRCALAPLKQIEFEQDLSLNAWAAHVRNEVGETVPIRSTQFTFEEIEDFIQNSQTDRFAALQPRVLRCILYASHMRDLLQRISRKIKAIKRILCQRESRFCAVNWSRRFWFLLHGSHPPKTEAWPFTCQVFGCA